MTTVNINPNLSVNTDDLRAKINACFIAKRVVSREVEDHLGGIVDLLDDLLVKANEAEEKRGKNNWQHCDKHGGYGFEIDCIECGAEK